MPERQRAYLEGKLVTILETKGRGKNAIVTIRHATGFVDEVKAKELEKIDPSEPFAKFQFENSSE